MRNEVVTRLHTELRGNYPGTWTADTDVLCQRVLRQLQSEIGDSRLRTACLSCMASEQFFNEANLRRHIPDAPSVRNRCARCKASDGWIEVAGKHAGLPYLVRCLHNGKMQVIRSEGGTCTATSTTYRARWRSDASLSCAIRRDVGR